MTEHLEQESGLALPEPVTVGAGVGESGHHPVAEPGDQRVPNVGCDGVAVLVAGEVGLVDQPAQGVGDLGRPCRVGVDLPRTG